MFLNRPQLAICAGVFRLAAFGCSAGEAEVYPGCAVPPTTFHHIWYIDPVNGKTPAEGGLGNRAAPWNSLQAAFSIQPGYKAPLLSTAPYKHTNPANPSQTISPGGGPIEPGDEVLLMSGNYGDISTSDWNVGLRNPAFVTIAAVASTYFVFSGITVEGTADSSPLHAKYPLILLGPHGPV
jgi:hypothetical protein